MIIEIDPWLLVLVILLLLLLLMRISGRLGQQAARDYILERSLREPPSSRPAPSKLMVDTPLQEGAQRYDYDTEQALYYDGEKWVPIASPVAVDYVKK